MVEEDKVTINVAEKIALTAAEKELAEARSELRSAAYEAWLIENARIACPDESPRLTAAKARFNRAWESCDLPGRTRRPASDAAEFVNSSGVVLKHVSLESIEKLICIAEATPNDGTGAAV